MPPTHPSQAAVAAAYRTLIAHETEPKEQDFYRTRLQRLEQATESVCEFDCCGRVAAAGVGIYCPRCSAKSADADLTTQLAIQQIEGEAAWWRSIDFDRNASRTFESMTGDSQQAVRTGVERVLSHLTAAGHLIPAGGMALTAEQVEDVRTVLNKFGFNQVTPEVIQAIEAAERLNRALFPATEPAEVISRYQTMQRGFAAKHFGFPANPVFEDRYTAPDGGKWQWTDELQWELRCYPPAPAVPAEEETKAEVDGDFIEIVFDGPPEAVSGRFVEVENPQGASISVGEWIDRGDGFWALRIPYPSSPVVPAPNETGPWQRIEDVPAGVLQIKDRHGRTWLMVGGTWRFEWHDGNWYEPHTNINAQAPFVEAEEG